MKQVTDLRSVFATSLRMTDDGKLVTINEKDNMTFEFGNFYVYGYRSYNSAMANLLRLFADTLLKRLDKLIQMRDGSNFINGGQYSSGALVHETIIYTPYAYYGYRGEAPCVKRKQSTFSFFPATEELVDTYGSYPMTVYGKERRVRGVTIQEGDHHHFDRVLGKVETYPLNNADLQAGRMYDTLFPEIKDRGELYVLSLRLDDMLGFVEIAAQMIRHHYFDGGSFDEKQAREQMKLLATAAAERMEEIV